MLQEELRRELLEDSGIKNKISYWYRETEEEKLRFLEMIANIAIGRTVQIHPRTTYNAQQWKYVESFGRGHLGARAAYFIPLITLLWLIVPLLLIFGTSLRWYYILPILAVMAVSLWKIQFYLIGRYVIRCVCDSGLLFRIFFEQGLLAVKVHESDKVYDKFSNKWEDLMLNVLGFAELAKGSIKSREDVMEDLGNLMDKVAERKNK